MAELVGGAVVGVGVTELWNKVKEVRNRVKDFKPQLEKLEETLEVLDPMIQDIRRTSTQLNEPDDVERLASLVQKGDDLVSKCLGIKRWEIWKRYSHQMELVEFDNELLRFNIRQAPLRILLAVNQVRLEQRRDFDRVFGRIVSVRQRLNISSGTLIFIALLPLVPVAIKMTVIFIIIYKAVAAVMSVLEKSESGIWMVINDIGKLDMTIEQLNYTMESLDHVLEELMNEADQSEAGESLRSLLEEGQKLVFEKSSLRWWNLVKKGQYQMTTVELENKLLRFHSLYLQDRLTKNNEGLQNLEVSQPLPTRSLDPEMKDDESFVPGHSDKDGHGMRGRHGDEREHESCSKLANVLTGQILLVNESPLTLSSSSYRLNALER